MKYLNTPNYKVIKVCAVFYLFILILNKIACLFNNMLIFIKVDLATGRAWHLTLTNNVSSFRVNIAFGISFAFMLYFRVIHLR